MTTTHTGAPQYGQTQSTVWGPFELSLKKPNNKKSWIEVSMHAPLPKPLQREARHVFGMDAFDEDACVVIPTNQRATVDLVSMRGEAVEAEKDRLLNVFMEFAATVCKEITASNYWADYIDPCSGLPMLTRHCNKVYSEVDGMECCLGYRSYSAGFCKVLEHPVWGTAVYPATIFSNAPKEIIIGILEQYKTRRNESNAMET